MPPAPADVSDYGYLYTEVILPALTNFSFKTFILYNKMHLQRESVLLSVMIVIVLNFCLIFFTVREHFPGPGKEEEIYIQMFVIKTHSCTKLGTREE